MSTSNQQRSPFRAFLLHALYAFAIMLAGGLFAFVLKRFL